MKKRTQADTQAHPGPSQVVPGIWWVGRGAWGEAPPLGSDGGCNVWLIRGARFDVLVDAGLGNAPASLERNLRAAGSTPERIREIWLTHSHWDHSAGAAKWAQRRPQTVVRISRTGFEYIRRKDYRLMGFDWPLFQRAWRTPRRLTAFKQGSALVCPPHRFRVVELPGHVPDLAGFRGRVAGLDVLFSGDAIIGDQGAAKGCVGWLDGLWRSSIPVYRKTVEAVLRDPPEVFLPGHGCPHAGASVRRSLRNCRKRLEAMARIPALHTMVPFA